MDLGKIATSFSSDPAPMRLRQGTVVSVQSDYTLTVTIGGSSVEVSGVRYLGSYAPRPTDQVWLLADGFDLIALGHLAPRGVPSPTATRSAVTTTISGTDAYIQFESVTNDGWGCWSSAQDRRLTAPIPGRYMAIGQVAFAGNATGFRYVFIERDGTTAVGEHREGGQVGGSPTPIQAVTPPFTMATGDYIRLGVRQTSGGNLDVNGGAQLGLIYLGPAE